MFNTHRLTSTIVLLIVTASALSGCTSDTDPLAEDEIGDLSVVVTLNFVDQGDETTNLAERLDNGSITFDPVHVAPNVTAYRVMEALQLRENFTIDVTYYVGMGAFVHTIDGVSRLLSPSSFWTDFQE